MLSAEFIVYGFSLFPSLFIRNDFTDDIREKKDDKFKHTSSSQKP